MNLAHHIIITSMVSVALNQTTTHFCTKSSEWGWVYPMRSPSLKKPFCTSLSSNCIFDMFNVHVRSLIVNFKTTQQP